MESQRSQQSRSIASHSSRNHHSYVSQTGMSLTFRVDERSARTALVCFPQGVSWDLEEMQVGVRERQSKRKRKRKVVASLNGVQFDSGSDSQKNDVSRYAIGVVNEKTGEVEVFPVDHPYVLRPQVHVQSGMRRESSALSNYERKQSLTEAFGSKKKQRAQRAMASNVISTENISGVNAVETVMSGLLAGSSEDANSGEVLSTGTETIVGAADKALEAHRHQLLPAFNLSTTEVKNCYPLHLLIPAQVMDSLGELFDHAVEAATSGSSLEEELEEQLQQRCLGCNRLVIGLFAHMKSTILKSMKEESAKKQKKYEKKSKERFILLTYLQLTIGLYVKLSTANYNHSMLKEDFVEALRTPSSNPTAVSRHLQDSFMGFRKMGGKNTLFSTKQLL